MYDDLSKLLEHVYINLFQTILYYSHINISKKTKQHENKHMVLDVMDYKLSLFYIYYLFIACNYTQQSQCYAGKRDGMFNSNLRLAGIVYKFILKVH